MDKHFRRTRPARYHDNRRPGFKPDTWSLDEARRFIRGDSDQGDMNHDDDQGDEQRGDSR